ncbi:putative WRKY transcription factor 53 [Bidens hawaiensis]|uniref:putative WRKY transcription factor 53 n=1 Tax=Bidens hawaiensis TaxID=980011 RepID=UPI00404986F2
MDSSCVYDEKTVIHELTQGLQMAQQLRVNLHSPEARDTLIQKILSSYDNALFALQSGYSSEQLPSLPESSISFGSPGSEDLMFDQPFSLKRKGSTTWEDQVITCSDNGLDGDINDGFSWRKYGQKDIQGAKFPRSYYRCSYRDVQKCFVTKQVQRRDEDPKVFDIKYKGKHTCSHCAQSTSPPPPPPPPPSPPSLPSTEKHEITPTYHQLSQPSPGETLSNLRANLSVNTLDLDGDKNTIFSFPSASSGVMEDFPNFYDCELLPIFSPPFIFPVTSESNNFTEWGSSQSLDILANPADVDTGFDFDFNKSLF